MLKREISAGLIKSKIRYNLQTCYPKSNGHMLLTQPTKTQNENEVK